MINIYRQCGVVHVDDRIHILFIMSKINLRRKYRIIVSLIPYKLLTSIYCFFRISPFLCKYDYLNEIILTSCYSTQQYDYANYLHNNLCVHNHCFLCFQNMFRLSYKLYKNNAFFGVIKLHL